MSQEDVELVRTVYEAHDRGESTAVFAAYDPEIEWHVLRVAELGFDSVYVGHHGVRTFWRIWLSAWETTSFEYDEFIDAGEHVVVVQSQRMRGGDRGGVELLRPGLDDPGRQGRAYGVLPHSRRSPRSRGAAGVGDVETVAQE